MARVLLVEDNADLAMLFQLVLEGRLDEARRVGEFFARVGLPVTLAQMGLGAGDSAALDTLTEGTLAFGPLANLTVDISAGAVRGALLDADRLGTAISGDLGDAAFRRLHG